MVDTPHPLPPATLVVGGFFIYKTRTQRIADGFKRRYVLP
jgi:hypothetical protein